MNILKPKMELRRLENESSTYVKYDDKIFYHDHTPLGRDIHDYYVIHDHKLGEGGFAKVRRGTNKSTGQVVAIKCFDKVKLGSDLLRVQTEIECLRRLSHPNIAELFDVFESPTNMYLILELCPGGELFDYIVSRSKLDEVEASRIFYDLIRVLDYIHRNGIAHRDLKPENVLFDDKKRIKLIDFGLAADCSELRMVRNFEQRSMDKLATCCGSITYAAPEIISGETYNGTKVDVWSAGVLLYALVVGKLPFNDPSIPALYRKIQKGLDSLPPFLSDELADLIRKMLATNPAQRITIGQILMHPWVTKFNMVPIQKDDMNRLKLPAILKSSPRPLMSLENRTYRRQQFNKIKAKVADQNEDPNNVRVCNVYRTPTKSSSRPTTGPQATFKTPAKLKYGPAEKKNIIKQLIQDWTPRKFKNPRKVLLASVKQFT